MRTMMKWLTIIGMFCVALGAYAQGPGVADSAAPTSMTLSQIIQAGGWIMYVLGAMSIGMVALIFYFLVVLRPETVTPRKLTREIGDLLNQGDLKQVRTVCNAKPSPVSAVTLSALDYAERADEVDSGLLKEIIEGEGSRQSSMIQGQTQYLLDIGVIAPMVGLLGTVLGMLTAFNAVALDLARAKPIYLAAGVSQALVTTAAGLLVGIPAMVFYSYFRGRTSKLISRLEVISAEILTQLIRKR